MLTAGMLKFDEYGRIVISGAPAVAFNGGTPVAADGSLASAVDTAPDVYLGAIGYTADDRITDSANPLLPPEGPMTNGDGQLAVDTSLPAYWYAGLLFTAAGRLSVSLGAPPEVSAFDNGYDQQAYD